MNRDGLKEQPDCDEALRAVRELREGVIGVGARNARLDIIEACVRHLAAYVRMKSPELDRVTCEGCNLVYSPEQVKIEWQGNNAQWKCPACWTIHDVLFEGENPLVFRKRGPRP